MQVFIGNWNTALDISDLCIEIKRDSCSCGHSSHIKTYLHIWHLHILEKYV